MAKNKLQQYILQQRDLGFSELYFPVETRVQNEKTVKRLGINKFDNSESLIQLEKTIDSCQKCPLGKTRTKFVFGVGNPEADILFIGEAPGRDEDQRGEPFVGRAGKQLDKLLAEVGLNRQDVYIANILKCRPPNNRDPESTEAEKCEPYLLKQIELINPKVICCLGRIAAQRLLNITAPLGAMRQGQYEFHGVKLFVTYHPAALLRTNAYTQPTIDDLKRVIAALKS
ncbi:MAG: uracil-DNA glycosylase [candidate division Zixibacteria bacterium]